MPFSKCSQYPVVGRISAKGIKNLNIKTSHFIGGKYLSQNYDLLSSTESNSRKGANNLWIFSEPCGRSYFCKGY